MKKYKSMQCICKGCGKDAVAKVVDEGIGSYEYWGATGYDSYPVVVTSCCEDIALDDKGNEISVEDVDRNFCGMES